MIFFVSLFGNIKIDFCFFCVCGCVLLELAPHHRAMQCLSSEGSCKPNDLNIPDGGEVYLPFIT